MPDSRRPFTKPALSPEQQVALLVNRGLSLQDRARTLHYLKFIGYYRLSGYFRPFQKIGDRDHTFFPGTTFDQVLQLYIFDRKLRLLVLDALERIEVACRSAVSNCMSEQEGPHWYLDPKHFVDTFDHEEFLAGVRRETGYENRRRQNVFCRHYYQKYSDPSLPPSWMVIEVTSLGTLSKIFHHLKSRSVQKKISGQFRLHYTILGSWLHSLTALRNICAHHERLWNRVLPFSPKKLKGFETHFGDGQRFNARAAVINVLLQVIADGSSWQKRLCDLLASNPDVRAHKMGFSENWYQDSFWNLNQTSQQ